MPIRVVNVCDNPIAGSPISLSKALNKWSDNQVWSRHICSTDRNDSRVYDSDLLLGVHSYEEIRKVMEEADIFHFHSHYSKQTLFNKHPELWDICLSKPRVWQAHSQRSITWMDIEEGVRDPAARHLVIGQYQPREWPECTPVPNIVDITLPELTPYPREWRGPLRVAYSPSRIGLTGWDDKGHAETVPILQKFVDRRLLTAEVIHDVPYRECLTRRGRAHIAIDEIVTGSYHLCSLEALSQGLATMAGLDMLQLQTIKDISGAEWHPWIIAIPETLKHRLAACVQDPAMVYNTAMMGRRWMEKYWHPRDMCQRYVDIYKEM
jgi:hypothetical protein